MGNSLLCGSTKIHSATNIDEDFQVITTKQSTDSQSEMTKSSLEVPVENKISSVKRVKIRMSKQQLEDLLSLNVSAQDAVLKLLKSGVQSLPERKADKKCNDRWRPALESIVEVI
jgi:autotransporter translocation and assembly factor TamB